MKRLIIMVSLCSTSLALAQTGGSNVPFGDHLSRITISSMKLVECEEALSKKLFWYSSRNRLISADTGCAESSTVYGPEFTSKLIVKDEFSFFLSFRLGSAHLNKEIPNKVIVHRSLSGKNIVNERCLIDI